MGNELIVQRSQALVTSQHRETATVPLNRRAKPDPDVTENGPSQTASTWLAINVHRAKAYVLLSPQSYSWSVQRLRASRNGSESRWLFPIQPPVSPLSCPWSPLGFISSFYPVTSLATSLTSTASISAPQLSPTLLHLWLPLSPAPAPNLSCPRLPLSACMCVYTCERAFLNRHSHLRSAGWSAQTPFPGRHPAPAAAFGSTETGTGLPAWGESVSRLS